MHLMVTTVLRGRYLCQAASKVAISDPHPMVFTPVCSLDRAHL